MYVPQRPCKVPIAPMGKWLTCLPRLTLAQLRTLRSTTVCTCRRDLAKFPSPRWEFLLTCPIDSHLSIRIDIWFYQSNVRACHACKLPIAPKGCSHVCACLCLQGGGVTVLGGTVSFSSCTITGNTAFGVRAHAQNFPSPQWDFHMFRACACRAAVFTSAVAR